MTSALKGAVLGRARALARDCAAVATLVILAGCRAVVPDASAEMEFTQLPTGMKLDPAGTSLALGSMPLSMVAAPGGKRLVVLLNGWREQGLQVVDRASGAVAQTVLQRAAFIGVAFSPDGKWLWASGGNQDVVYRYAWEGDTARLADSVILMEKARPRAAGKSYPAGLAFSPDGAKLYVAENLADSLAVIDVATQKITQRLSTGRYPYAIVVSSAGTVYVSVWGGDVVRVYQPGATGMLGERAAIKAGRHPSALLLDATGINLYVASASTDRIAVVDTRHRAVVAWLNDPPPAGPGEGSTPNALALSGNHLFVAEADNNAIAVFGLSSEGTGRILGRIPTEWYPTGVIAVGDTLLVLTGKGHGTGPNPDGPNGPRAETNHRAYTLGQTTGSLVTVAIPPDRALPAFSARVAAANGWNKPRTTPKYPPFQHVIYVIKENRTYDQVLGDLPMGDGDSSLTYFPRAVSPNHHALAERFGVFDRFFVNSEVSADGHQWATAAYATDYTQKTTPSNYSSRGRSFDYQGLNRGKIPDDDAAEPANGHLWDLAERTHVTYRNFGEDVEVDSAGKFYTTRRALQQHTNFDAPPFELSITDQRRADVFLAEFKTWVASGTMPQLTILLLSSDHTAGAAANHRTPKAYVADNDLALGRVVDALTHSPFWASTVMFVLEDDAQNGPDHIDSHRSPFFVISPYSPKGVVHRFANQSDVVATIGEILHMGALSQFDYYGRPLREVWRSTADLTPYTMLTPSQPLDEMNPVRGRGSEESLKLDFSGPDRSDDELFNHILWEAIKGAQPYPGTARMSLLEVRRR